MKNLMEMRQARKAIIDQAAAILETAKKENRGLSEAEDEQYNGFVSQSDLMLKEIEMEERAQEEELRAGKVQAPSPGKPQPGRPTPIGPVIRCEERMADLEQFKQPAEANKLNLGRFVRGLVTGEWEGAEAERRAMAEGTLSAGGYMVPTPLALNVIDLARKQARVMQAGAQTVPMTSNKLTIARVTGDPSASWKAENAPGTFSDMTFDALNFNAHTLIALVKVSRELLEDAQGIDGVINTALAEALALELDRVSLYGSGTGDEPKGLKNTAGVLKLSMGANGAQLTDYDEFSQAVQAVREQNGEPNSAMYAPRTAGAIDRMKDTTGQPLQAPESFKTLKKHVTNQIPTNLTQGSATTASDAFVGDFTQLLIGMRATLQIEVSNSASDDSGSAFTQHQVWIKATLRADVQVAKPKLFDIIEGII